MELAFLAKGLLVGFTIAAPVGPIGILCIRRTLVYGPAVGLLSGLGAASADAIYGLIAAFGLTIIANFLMEQQFWLRIIGGVFLCSLAYRSFTAHVAASDSEPEDRRDLTQAYLSTFFLTISNPVTVIAFLAIFASLGLGSTVTNYLAASFMVLGVFSGSALWWIILSRVVNAFRSHFNNETLIWINKIAGGVLAVFGVAAVLSVF